MVSGNAAVFPQAIYDVRADMNLFIPEIGTQRSLRKNIGYVEQRTGIVAGFLTLPGIKSAAAVNFGRFALRAGERMDAILYQAAGDLGIGKIKKRQHEHLGVPEGCALIYLAGKAARPVYHTVRPRAEQSRSDDTGCTAARTELHYHHQW